MKKPIRSVMYLLCLSLAMTNCTKDDVTTTPETTKETTNENTDTGENTDNNNTDNGGNTDNTNVTEADVKGLKKNYFKVGTTIEEYFNSTNIEVTQQKNASDPTSVEEDYLTIHTTSAATTNDNISITIKASALKEGNFSLKTWQLGSTPSANEAVVRVSVAGNLMDATTTTDKLLSIKKDADGFFVIKLAPLVMKNKNSWDDIITDPISFHLVVNNEKIITNNEKVQGGLDHIFSSSGIINGSTPKTHGNNPNLKVASIGASGIYLSFYDYDLTVNSLAKASYPLAKEKVSASNANSGNYPKSIRMSAKGWQGWINNPNKDQNIEMEIKENSIIITFTDIEIVKANDNTQSEKVSGSWEFPR